MISRYTLPGMEKIWSEEEKFSNWLKIEILVCEAWAKLEEVPADALKKIKQKARFNKDEIEEIEKEVKHDVIAFLTNVAKYVGPEARYIHLGLTSSDILDTSLALQMRKAADIIIEDTERLIFKLREKAIQYKNTPIMGRTHGVHAEPITLGLKFALWYEEMKRNLKRIKEAQEEISYGKISGAVGTYAHLNPEVERLVCEKLGLKVAGITNQIIQRDRHAFYLSTLAIIACSVNKFALEIRGLQRTEISEMEEGFGKRQKGSSAMPHKKNPISCEQICGLARLVRSNLQAALENISLWGERDISHSSCERVIIPDSTILVDYMLEKFIQILDNLQIFPDNMIKNMGKSRGLFFSQRILLRLVEKGVSREQAYRWVQKNAIRCWKEGNDFKNLIKQDPDITRYLSEEEIENLFDLNYYFRWVDKIMQRIN
ncbi:adenylosuccinate lyase [Patescibacteria group bacterium]|nr:adenylosuccinate lyase [Patescibacteria group bacterium]